MPKRHAYAPTLAAALLALFLVLPQAWAEEAAKPAASSAPRLPQEAVTHHRLELGGGQIDYTATAGTLPLRDDKGEIQADIFYVAFVRDGVADPQRRPITYAFNGGPGAAAAYLDIGALGPRALDFGAAGTIPPVADHVGDNPDTWLSFTDLVFIDPVGTGYSRAAGGDEAARKFWSVRQDLDALARVIRLHLTRSDRLTSPVYLAGESYGGFRAARLAHELSTGEGIAPAGVTLISPVLEFRLMSGDEIDVLPWALRLPSYAAVTLEGRGALAPEALRDSERYALGDYLVSLASPPSEPTARQQFYARVASLIGLPEASVARWHGRVPLGAYVKERRRNEGQIVSRYDGTVVRPDPEPRTNNGSEDPILSASIAPFTRAFVAYVRDELDYKTDRPYELLNQDVNGRWDWHDGRAAGRDSIGTIDQLRRALSLQPKLHLLIAHGLTDLQTPYMMSRYVVEHLGMTGVDDRVQLKLYAGGHMMYLRASSRHHLHEDAKVFYGAAGEE